MPSQAMLLELAKFHEPKTDWQKIIFDLHRAGITYEQMEFACKGYHGWMARVRDEGVEPRHSVGQMLLAMHRAYVKK